MRKTEELNNPQSCLNRAADDELVFVLRGHDVAAPSVIRAWTRERVRLGKNTFNDEQIKDALQVADTMEHEQRNGK